MKLFLFVIMVLFCLVDKAVAEVIPYEDEYIHLSLPEGWVKASSKSANFSQYFNWQDPQEILYFQLHRERKWAQWHMKGMSKKIEVFRKHWGKQMGLYASGELQSLTYDSKSYILTMVWSRSAEERLVSKMKLTSFGCIAFHKIVASEREVTGAKQVLGFIIESVELPERLEFYPEDVVSEIVNNMGGAIGFIVVSMMYLMFSLFQRSNMHQRRAELRLESRLST